MQIALDLARKCSGFTFPNPPVGCVIVEYDKIKKDHKDSIILLMVELFFIKSNYCYC